MTTKVKGLLKGLRYISQIFDEEKEKEMQIGFPTDVKHVAHIGWDGPAVDAPSWMKEFKSAPLAPSEDSTQDSPEVNWVSDDSKRVQKATISSGKDHPEVPKPSRRHPPTETNTNDPPCKKDSSTRSRQPSRHLSKDKDSSSQQQLKSSVATGSSPRNLPDIPGKSRRKKCKESDARGSTRSRARASTSSGTYTSSYSDTRPDTESVLPPPGSQQSSAPRLQDEVTEYSN